MLQGKTHDPLFFLRKAVAERLSLLPFRFVKTSEKILLAFFKVKRNKLAARPPRAHLATNVVKRVLSLACFASSPSGTAARLYDGEPTSQVKMLVLRSTRCSFVVIQAYKKAQKGTIVNSITDKQK